MHKKIGTTLAAVLVCVGCGGWIRHSGGSGQGLLFFRSTGSGPVLHRIDGGGGSFTDVAGSDDAFEGSMDQSGNVYTSLNPENIYRISGGIATPLTSSGADFRPCVTPDGSRIAFVSSRDGNNEIYVMDGSGAGQTNVSNNSGSDTFPAISQDGSKVVFTSNRNGNDEIYIVDFDGTHLTRLTNDSGSDTSPAFTPDSSHVIFSSNRSGIYQIYQMDTAGANLTQITTGAGDKFHGSYDVDGTAIFFYSSVSGVRQIFRCNSDGNFKVQLTTDVNDSDKTCTWVY